MSCKAKHIAIVGAGASGLFLARKLSEHPQLQVTVFEKNRQVGAKLRASGGGKANIFNRDIRPEHYNQPEFVAELLQHYSPEQLENQLAEWGLVTITDEEGRVYPASQFSQTVVDVLTHYPNENVQLVTNYDIQHLDYKNRKWKINDSPTLFDVLVLASGSPAGMIPKNQRGYNHYLQDLALKINLSSQKNCRLEINLTYWDENFDTSTYLRNNRNTTGLLHPKLAALHQQKPFDIHRLTFQIEDTYPLEGAQVCHGGIDLSEIDYTFAAKRFKNLYILGEMLDVDGVCGGYNLFFAFASAAVAGNSIM